MRKKIGKSDTLGVLILSSKRVWPDEESESGYATVGGFPAQIRALADLFEGTVLVVMDSNAGKPGSTIPLIGDRLEVRTVPAPAGLGWQHKVGLLWWLPRHFPLLWRAVAAADCVHAPVPGDLGLIGILVALAQRKPLFVRHCGTWGEPVTIADRFLLWLLERSAGGRNVVMATGGGGKRPSHKNPAVTWIHSTTLREKDIEGIVPAVPWCQGEQLRLVTVGRVTPEKNAAAAIRALPMIHQRYPQTYLDIVGDGPALGQLRELARDLQVERFVQFHGNVSHEQVLSVLHSSHLFVFPTKVREGFPKAVLEAMACGLPVVATAVSVLPVLVGTNNGRVLPDSSADAVADAVLELLDAEKGLARMGESARETSRAYTLEVWQNTIGQRLEKSWGPGFITKPYAGRS